MIPPPRALRTNLASVKPPFEIARWEPADCRAVEFAAYLPEALLDAETDLGLALEQDFRAPLARMLEAAVAALAVPLALCDAQVRLFVTWSPPAGILPRLVHRARGGHRVRGGPGEDALLTTALLAAGAEPLGPLADARSRFVVARKR